MKIRKNQYWNHLQKRYLRVRKDLGMSQTELGEKVGLSRQSISSLERGTVQMTWDTLLAIMMVVMVNDVNMYERLVAEDNLGEAIEDLKR